MLLEQNISEFGISYFVEVGQRFSCRQTRTEFLKVAPCGGEKKNRIRWTRALGPSMERGMMTPGSEPIFWCFLGESK